MSIVLTEIESIHGATNQQRFIFYRCQDHLGAWHQYGPIITIDPNFDAEAYKSTVADKINSRLIQAEIDEVLA